MKKPVQNPVATSVGFYKKERKTPEYWQNLGSSKSRTKNQEAQSREIIEKIIEGCDENTVIAFTDGSCLGNPGPCGAGARNENHYLSLLSFGQF